MRPRSAAVAALAALCACFTPLPPRLPAPADPGHVDTPRGRLRVDDGGAGPGVPVLFLHGAGGDRRVWAAQLAHLRSGRRAVALDLPGFGESPPPKDGDLSVGAMAAAVDGAAVALRLEHFVLVAHSYGGAVASAYAGAHPEKVAGLYFVDAMGDQRTATAAERAEEAVALSGDRYRATVAERFAFILKGARASTASQVLGQLKATAPASFRGAILSTFDHDAAAALARYPGPKAALAAAQFAQWGIQAKVPGITTETMEGVSHWPMLDEPAEVDRRLDAFLAGLK